MRTCCAINTQPINALSHRIFTKSFKRTYIAAGLLWTRRNLDLRISMLYYICEGNGDLNTTLNEDDKNVVNFHRYIPV